MKDVTASPQPSVKSRFRVEIKLSEEQKDPHHAGGNSCTQEPLRVRPRRSREHGSKGGVGLSHLASLFDACLLHPTAQLCVRMEPHAKERCFWPRSVTQTGSPTERLDRALDRASPAVPLPESRSRQRRTRPPRARRTEPVLGRKLASIGQTARRRCPIFLEDIPPKSPCQGAAGVQYTDITSEPWPGTSRFFKIPVV